MQTPKSRAKGYMLSKLQISLHHKIATLLHQRFRQLRFFKISKRKSVKYQVENELDSNEDGNIT
jgi:hypothetical protein